MDRQVEWLSPLGVGVALILVWGALNVVIGALVPFAVRAGSSDIFVISARSDAVVFGAPTEELLARDPALDTLRRLSWQWFSGPLMSFGVAAVALAWFGVRAGQIWALVALTLALIATLISAGLVLELYVRRGAPLGLADVPPLFTVAASAGALGIVLSWFGLSHAGG